MNENIHQMRTSFRRLEAVYRSSPKEIRKKKILKLLSKWVKNYLELIVGLEILI